MFSFLRPIATFSVLLVFSAGDVVAPAQDSVKKARQEEVRYAKQLAAEEARYTKQVVAAEANYLKAAAKAAKEQVKAAQTPEEARYAKEQAKAIKEQAQANKEPKADNKKQPRPTPGPTPAEEVAALTARPEMFGYGHWPKGTPTWFIQLDEDHDGQVGLYEWHARGLRVADYQALDLNDDGLLTFEEWFRWAQEQANASQAMAWTPSGFTRDKPTKGSQGR